MSKIATTLTSLEIQEGGPYRTWLTKSHDDVWRDVDVVVNSTIGHCLSLFDIHLPKLDHFISTSILEGRLSSPYYPSIFHVCYFVSRYYDVGHGRREKIDNDIRARLAEIITAQLKDSGSQNINPLERAMAISSLAMLGHVKMTRQTDIDLLVSRLEHEGFMPYAFCIDPSATANRTMRVRRHSRQHFALKHSPDTFRRNLSARHRNWSFMSASATGRGRRYATAAATWAR